MDTYNLYKYTTFPLHMCQFPNSKSIHEFKSTHSIRLEAFTSIPTHSINIYHMTSKNSCQPSPSTGPWSPFHARIWQKKQKKDSGYLHHACIYHKSVKPLTINHHPSPQDIRESTASLMVLMSWGVCFVVEVTVLLGIWLESSHWAGRRRLCASQLKDVIYTAWE